MAAINKVEAAVQAASKVVNHRSEQLVKPGVNLEARTVELCFSSEKPFARDYGFEILDHSPDAFELDWLNSGNAPFMVAANNQPGHTGAVQIGSVVAGSARVDAADRRGRATVKISRSPLGDAFLNDVQDEIAVNISFGYRLAQPNITRGKDGTATVRWMKVTPREITRVTLPADDTVGIARGDAEDDPTDNKQSEVTDLTAEEQLAAKAEAARAAELQRLDDIAALGKRFNMEATATRCALEGQTVDQARTALLAELNTKQTATPVVDDATREDATGKKADTSVITIHSTVRSFAGTRDEAARKAYRFAQWFVASNLGGRESTVVARAKTYCKDQNIPIVRAAQTEGDDSAGGFLVPTEFNNDMIDLREKFGVFRRNVRIVPMSSDTRSQPRRKGGLTAYVIGEGTGATESRKNWDRVGLSTKKIGCLARYSSEIAEDALVSIGDDLASEIAYAFTQFEDTVGFTGDGSVNHARITGAVTKLQNLASAKGVVTASGNTWDEFALIDFLTVIGKLPEYAETANVKWFMSKVFWATVASRIQLQASGNNRGDIAAGGTKTFLGYPVEVSQVFPKAATNDKIMCLFGDLRLAAMMGDRRGTTIRTSEHVHFEEEEIAIAGSERFDINVHDIGDTATEGPLLGLKCAAS
jgi:HK97 family phage major capsid protein